MRWTLPALCILSALPACSDAFARGFDDPTAGDAGVMTTPDGGDSQDGRPGPGPTEAAMGYPLTDRDLSEPLLATESTCYDGLPNEPGDALDCASPACQFSRACCIGSVDCCGPAPGLDPVDLDFQGCATGDRDAVAACLAPLPLISFGDATGRIVPGGLAPGGSTERAGGVLLYEALSPETHRLDITVTFAPPTECGSGCVDSAAIALLTATASGQWNVDRPAIGLLLSDGGREIRLAVQGEIIGQWPSPPAGDTQPSWRLRIDPSGSLHLSRDDRLEPLFTGPVPLPATAALALYGRNRNPAGPDVVSRFAQVSAALALCDIPHAWGERQPLDLYTGPASEFHPESPSQPSLSKDDEGHTYLAFVNGEGPDRVIHFARQAASSATTYTLYGNADSPSLVPEGDTESLGISAPSLLWIPEENRLYLYYIRWDEFMTGRLNRASWDPTTFSFSRGAIAPILPSPRDASIDNPTLIQDGSGSWLLIYRESTPDAMRWVMAVSPDGIRWTEVTGSDIDARLKEELRTVDESRGPTLTTHAGAYVIHYSRRRGARWSIGALASHSFLYWRRLDEESAILDRSETGFDGLSVRDPAAGVTETGLEMVYIGTDGTRQQLGYTTRAASHDGTFSFISP